MMNQKPTKDSLKNIFSDFTNEIRENAPMLPAIQKIVDKAVGRHYISQGYEEISVQLLYHNFRECDGNCEVYDVLHRKVKNIVHVHGLQYSIRYESEENPVYVSPFDKFFFKKNADRLSK